MQKGSQKGQPYSHLRFYSLDTTPYTFTCWFRQHLMNSSLIWLSRACLCRPSKQRVTRIINQYKRNRQIKSKRIGTLDDEESPQAWAFRCCWRDDTKHPKVQHCAAAVHDIEAINIMRARPMLVVLLLNAVYWFLKISFQCCCCNQIIMALITSLCNSRIFSRPTTRNDDTSTQGLNHFNRWNLWVIVGIDAYLLGAWDVGLWKHVGFSRGFSISVRLLQQVYIIPKTVSLYSSRQWEKV